MTARRTCPHCGHQNLERAVYCFQCGEPLVDDDTSPQETSGPRRSQRTVQAMWSTELPEGDKQDPRDLPGTGFLQELRSEEPLTCLVCGTLNQPTALTCANCGTPLIVPDQDTRLVAHASARTDVGLVRENNEDSVGLWASQGVLLALVADGMGGAVAGEEASRLTVEAVQADFVGVDRGGIDLLTWAEEMIMEKLEAAIQAANLAVIDRVDKDTALRGMGTTATLAFVRGRRALFAHVGDSRAYLVDGEEEWISQITSDHSFVEALLEAGHITEEQARDHPMKNVLYRALGQAPDTTADVYNRYLKGQDRIVLCSDGLTRHVTPDEIAQVVLLESNPEVATQRLIDLANERGGEDNISVIVILMHEIPGTGPFKATKDRTREKDAHDPDATAPLPPRKQRSGPTPSPADEDPEDTIPVRRTLFGRRARTGYGLNEAEANAAAELFSPGETEGAAGYSDDDTVETVPTRDRLRQAFQMDAGDDVPDVDLARGDASAEPDDEDDTLPGEEEPF